MTYPITHWYGIRPEFISKDRLMEAQEAGFTIIECDYDRDTNLKVLAWCRELGLEAHVRDERIGKALDNAEGWETMLDELAEDYALYNDIIQGFFIRDEPMDNLFPELGRVAAYLHGKGLKEYINLLPYHAPMGFFTNEGETMHDRYQRHLDGFCDAVKPTILSYDHYNLGMEEVPEGEAIGDRTLARLSEANRARNGWETKVYVEKDTPNYYNNLEIIRDTAAARNIPWMDIILLVEHWGYRWLTDEELRWEAFTALAYGSTALSYFTYWTPGVDHDEPWSYQNGIILSNGIRGEKYAVVKQLNRELQTMYGGLALPLPGETDTPTAMVSKAVFHVGEEIDELVKPFAGYGKLTAVTGNRHIVGCFEGNRFIVTNKDFKAPATVTLTADGTLYRLDKYTGTWVVCDGTFTIKAGDAEMFAVI
mgnify:CR=1 FL=1